MPRSLAYEERYRKWRRMVRTGINPHNAGRLCGISADTTRRWLHQLKSDDAYGEEEYDDVFPLECLNEHATRALGDFGYFRRRYFGRITLPWQEEAAHTIVTLLDTDDKEYLVVNAPPGGGKSTLFTHDIPAWLIVRNRNIRILEGSRTARIATQYTGRLRRTLERQRPVRADTDDIRKGLALDAEATLIQDFGRFKPLANELWRRDEFIVAAQDDEPSEDKEPTVSAYGMDTQFLGGRYDYVIWDDLIDKKTLRSREAMETLIAIYVEEMETRVDPGGCLVLQGQRLRADDLYRFALDLRTGDDEDQPKYHHVVFRGHYEDRCEGEHTPDAPPYPEGCLLDPKRVPWKDQSALLKNDPKRYAILYQQEDTDPTSTLVQREWIDGDDGHPGCWDDERRPGTIPKGLDLTQCISIATVDPSPTKYWAIEWIIWEPANDIRWLIDIIREPMGANELLDFNINDQSFSGLMHEWQQRSVDLNAKITTWIVESNAAQRFMLQYHWFKMWQAREGVDVIPHQTSRNKLDEELGVETIGSIYRWGRMRLPRKGGNSAVHTMVSELTHYPHARTDDTVMAHWFFEWHKHNFPLPETEPPVFNRPTWLRGSQRGMAG